MVELTTGGRLGGIFASEDPYSLARAWLSEAEGSEPEDANAVALATVDARGLPNVRMVLLKEIEASQNRGGFVFYTNFDSAKGQELKANSKAAMIRPTSSPSSCADEQRCSWSGRRPDRGGGCSTAT